MKLKFLHFLIILLFCVGCFFTGRFLAVSFDPAIIQIQTQPTYPHAPSTSVILGRASKTENKDTSIISPTRAIPSNLPVVSSEQNTSQSKIVPIPPGARLGNQEGWNIFIKDIQIAFDEKKRVITGSYTLENFDEKSLESMYIQMVLMIPRKQEGYPPMYFDAQITEKFSITGKSEQKKDFSYPVRAGVSGENAQILIEAHMGSGDMITFIHSPKITISGASQILTIKSPRLIDSLKQEYLIGDGPTIYGDREPKNLTFSYSIVNDNKSPITVTPTLDIHLFSESGPVVAQEKSNPITLKTGTSPVLTFALPSFEYKPGIYLAKLLLLDANGINRGLDVPIRWIVGGDVARIINVVSQNNQTEKGKNITGKIEYTGTPPDINPTNSTSDQREGIITLQLEEKNGAPLSAPLEKTVILSAGQKTQSMDFTLLATESSLDPSLRVIIRNMSGTILDEKVFSLKNSFFILPIVSSEIKIEEKNLDTNSSNKIVYLFIGLICIGLSFFFRKFLSQRQVFIFFICCIVGLFWVPRTEAYVSGCETAGINISGPSASNTFMCGQTYTFTGGWWMNACANTDAAMYVQGNLVDYNWGINCVKPPCEYLIPKSGSFAVNKTMPANYNGYYQVHIPWSKSQGDCSNSGTAVYGVNVVCPIAGSCGSIHGTNQFWPTGGSWCGTGPMSGWTQVGDISNGNVWRWNCLGQYGGSDAACYFVQQCGAGHFLNYGSCQLYRCFDPAWINFANASPVSFYETPSSLTLTRDYNKTLVTKDVYGVAADTPEKCEYTCNPGYVRDVVGGLFQCRFARCDANPTTVFTNAVPVTNLELPTTVPYTFHKDYTQTLVINGTDTAEKCEYTCVNGYRADLTKNPKQCVPIVCSGSVATNGLKCADDEANLSGHLDIPRVRRTNEAGCTGPQKCEWYCPKDKPIYCATKNECVASLDDCGCDKGEKMCGCGQCIAGNLTCPSTNIVSQTLSATDIVGLLPPRPDTTYPNNYGIPNDLTTINKICTLAGFLEIINVTNVVSYDWGSPYNEYSAQWVGSAWNFSYGRPNQIMSMTCNGRKNLTPTTCIAACNNDGVCSDNESCDCGDCTNGDSDDNNNCKAKDGLRCTRDDTQPMCTEGACCPTGTAWNCTTNSCEKQCGTHVPSELKAGIDIPYITCDAEPGTTHFRYEITKVSGQSISATSSSTHPHFKIQKLLAKAINGVCPADPSAYVPNLTGIVTNDEICVRLLYNNATSGAVSNALITDSLPTGFTRIDNSTKNCLTPTGSPELCSDATGMGGAIGNNGWSGNNFSLTPHAGFYAISTNKTTGDKMEMPRKRYLLGCTIQSRDSLTGSNITHTQVMGGVNTSPGFTSVANNWSTTITPVPTNTQCAQLFGHSSTNLWNNTNYGYQPLEIDILGRKNLLSCNVQATNVANFSYKVYTPTVAVNNNPGFTNKESGWPSNLNPQPTNAECAQLSGFNAGVFPYPPAVNNTGSTNQPFQTDLTQGRFLLHCVAQGDGNMQYVPLATINNVSNATLQTNLQCFQLAGHPGTTNAVQNTPGNANTPYVTDLLDTTNGKGYIQYKIKATTSPTNILVPDVTLLGVIMGVATPDTSKSNATINATITSNTGSLVYTSNIFVNGTSVKHTGPLVNPGTYSVRCLYGSATSTVSEMTPSACTKSIAVKDQNDTSVQGCSRIYAYKGNTLSDVMTNPSSFDASFRCGSRHSTGTSLLPYRLINGSQTSFLSPDMFSILGLGFVSTQTQNYTFNTASEVTCAVKVGDGYSTNESCRIRTCVGTDCATPETFIITPSSNAVCSKDLTFTYDIGCNEQSPDYTKCVAWMYRNSGTSATPVYPTIKTRENGVEKSQSLSCSTTVPPGALGPVTNCTIILPTGGLPVTVFSGDANSFQTTLYTLSRDTLAPTASVAYYTNNNTIITPSQYQLWQRQPVTGVITCTDRPGKSDGSNCACAPTLLETSGQQYWSLGVPNASGAQGADVMTYSRVFVNNSTGPGTVTVRDTAGNSTPLAVTNIGIDSVAPKITISSTATDKITLSVTDPVEGGSGLWKPGSLRPIPSLNPILQKNPLAPALLYRTFSKAAYVANPSLYEFNDTCLLTTADNGDYYAYGQPGASMTQTLSNLTVAGITGSFTNTTNMISYCVQDNAGNVTRGVYPSDLVGCFSATNLSVIPTLSTWKNLLLSKLSSGLSETQKYGYSLSESVQNTSCFEGILSSNISTLVTSQYNPQTGTFSWDSTATIQGLSGNQKNTKGYYYYRDTTSLPALPTATSLGSLLTLSTSPTGTGQKVIVAEGKNIQINSDIKYFGGDKLLVIIARKNAAGGGGNILVDPSVSRIDALLIADGALINATNGTLHNTVTNASLLTNRLTINGRLYSFNTRAGSLASADLSQLPATTSEGRYFSGNALITNGTLTQSVQTDLERFRMILADGNPLCTLHIQYQALTNTNLPPILQRPAYFSSGTCSF